MDQNVRELEAFSAVIYSSNFDLELLGASKRAEAADPPDTELTASSFGAVMVDRETDTSADLAQSAPILVDNDDEGTGSGHVITDTQEGQELHDSTFERAWGKAVEDGKTDSEAESQAP